MGDRFGCHRLPFDEEVHTHALKFMDLPSLITLALYVGLFIKSGDKKMKVVSESLVPVSSLLVRMRSLASETPVSTGLRTVLWCVAIY